MFNFLFIKLFHQAVEPVIALTMNALFALSKFIFLLNRPTENVVNMPRAGFEPASQPRKGCMIDRPTPPGPSISYSSDY